MRNYQNQPAVLLYILFLFALGACNTSPRNIPFPQQESEFAKPAIEKLTFGEQQKLDWITVSPESLKFVETKFDLKAIPSKPFDIGNPRPLTSPMKDTIFDWKNIPDTVFNFDKLPSVKLRYKTTILGQPKRVKSGMPRLKDGASESLLLFGLDQGLSGTIGSCIIQDKNGIMWIGTDNGICRFDGEYCEIYSLEQGLGFSWVTKLFEDSKGQIWISYQKDNGLSVLNKKTSLIKHITTAEGLAGNRVNSFMEDSKGQIWVGTNRGINVIDEKAGTIKLINRSVGLSQNFISNIFKDSRERFWIAVPGRGIDMINFKDGRIKRFGTSQGLGNNSVICFSEDNEGQIWVATFTGGLKVINENKGSIKQLTSSNGLANDRIRDMTVDRDGKIWIGTNNGGVDVYSPKNETIKNLSIKEGLSNNNVMAVYADKQGQVWIGTNGGEVDIYNTNGGNLQHLTSARGLSNKTGFYYAFTEDSHSRIWVGSSGILDVIDEKAGTLKSISTKEGLTNPVVQNLFTDSRGRVWISNGNAVIVIDEKAGTLKKYNTPDGAGKITEDKAGQIWVGSFNTVYVFNEKAGNIRYAKMPPGYTNNYFECILMDRKGKTWLGSAKGVDIIDKKAGTISHISVKNLADIEAQSLLEDSRGNIWIGTTGNGLFMIDQQAGTVTNFTVGDGLEDMIVYSVNERKGSIYAGTGRGPAVLTPVYNADTSKVATSWQIKSYGKPQGFLRVDHNPRSLLSNDGRLWFAIADVLTIMDEPRNDTLVSATFLTAVDIMERSPNFLTNKWVNKQIQVTDTIWNMEKDTFYTKNNFPPDTSYLQKHNIRWDSAAGPYNMPVRLSLPYNQNHLTFHFTGTHLDNLNKTRYRYVLEGNDKTWSNSTDKAFADYRNLSHGKYTFKVSNQGFNGKWSTPVEFRFTIRPPWWLSIWAYAFYGLCLIALFATADAIQRQRVIVKERERTREMELAQAKEIEKAYTELKTTQTQLIQSEKMASLGELTAGIAHEIQNPLNFVNNFSEVNAELIGEMKEELSKGNIEEAKTIADNINDNEQKILFHGKRADSIVKGMLQHSRSSNGVKENTDINALADEYLRLAYHGLRAKDKSFNATMKTDYDENIGNINIIPQDIGRVILNLITNAFYAASLPSAGGFSDSDKNKSPTVWVSTKKQGSGILISVKDNGPGIPKKILDKIFQPFFTTKPTGQGTGLGLSLSYDIVKAHGGEIKVKTEENNGTEFSIILPV
ncbi:MAG: hypothetical protein IPP43_14485 [Chitinophagaceae bacterium]|nr:hypothetical protein [Chitinophagaceae bacterium]